MTLLTQTKLSIAEAAFVTGVSAKDIDREIDAKVIRSSGPRGARALSGDALVYIKALGHMRTELKPALRKRMWRAVVTAVAKGEPVAKVDRLQVEIKEIRNEILHGSKQLDQLKRNYIEMRPSVLGGEPVLRGTRIPIRVVADLVRKGASIKEIKGELGLSSAQIDASVKYDQVTPRRGRPPMKRRKVKQHVPAD